MNLKTYTTAKLPKDIYRKLYDLNFRGYGMRSVLRDKRGKVIIAYIENEIVGWAIYYKQYYQYYRQEYEAQFYVKQKYRRKGIGTKLYKKIKSRVKNFDHIAHDPVSYAFFSSQK